jgi:hypothetical protein
MQSLKEINKQHPAVKWALNTDFSPVQVDCTTTVALKILDGKCKMLPGEKAAVLAIYDVVKPLPGELFSQEDHNVITQARCTETASKEVMNKIHFLRLYAETHIFKPVMKAYKAKLRDGLFG